MKITAHSLDILPTQKLSLPTGAKLLTVNVDHRFNKCLLWTFQDDNAPEEELTFTMAKLGDEVLGGGYVGTFKDNSGYVHVFAERPVVIMAVNMPAPVPVVISAKAKPVLAEAAK